MLVVPWEGSHTAAGPGWFPATVVSEASTALKKGSFGTPTTILHPVPLLLSPQEDVCMPRCNMLQG